MEISRKWFSLPCILVALATTPVAIANPDAPVRRVPAGTLVDADLSRYPAVMMPGVPLSGQKRPGGVKGWQRINPKMQEALAATAIAQGIKNRMDGKSVGYAVTVMTSSGARATATGGYARKSPPDSNQRGMAVTDRITIASVSKPITAAAMLRVMASKGISLDESASKFLPADWTSGSNFKTITIRELLSHTSGIRSGNGCNISFDGLKKCVADGIAPANKVYKYANENYALMRIILPRIYGSQLKTEEDYARQYEVIVNRMVLNSAGIPYATCKAPASSPALSYESVTDNGDDTGAYFAGNYDWDNLKPGIDWGDMTLRCGSQGWNLSADELARFMHTLSFTEKILPQSTVDQMRSENLGLFWRDFGEGLEGWGHGGWHPARWNNGEINTWVFTFNNGITVGVVINSRYSGNYATDIAEAVREVMK